MSAAATLAGAAPGTVPDWHAIHWRKVWHNVRRLQARIVKATQEGRWGKVHALVYLLTHSYSGRAAAIVRVTTNPGASQQGIGGGEGCVPRGAFAKGLSRMRGNSHVRFLGEGPMATSVPYPTQKHLTFAPSGGGSRELR